MRAIVLVFHEISTNIGKTGHARAIDDVTYTFKSVFFQAERFSSATYALELSV